MDSRTLALLCRTLADNKKAENLVVLDVRNLSSITDYFVLASGATEPHLRAIVSEVQDRLRADHALRPRAVEGDAQAPWQVLDYFDVIVHVMRTDLRVKYDLETLWGDAPRVTEDSAQESEPAKFVRNPRAVRISKAAKPTKTTRSSKSSKTAKATKVAKVAKVVKASKTAKPAKRTAKKPAVKKTRTPKKTGGV